MTVDEALRILKRSFSIAGSFNDNPKRYYEALRLVITTVEKDRKLINYLFNSVDEMQKVVADWWESEYKEKE